MFQPEVYGEENQHVVISGLFALCQQKINQSLFFSPGIDYSLLRARIHHLREERVEA